MDYESRNHSESDEAVDDRGAAFQNRNHPDEYKRGGFDLSNKKKGGQKASNEDEELEHTESEEGNNQDNPNFDGNDRMFSKRKDNFAKGDQSKNGKLL